VKRQIVEGHVPGRNHLQVGPRGYYPDAEAFEDKKHYLSPLTVDDGRR